MLRSPQVCGHAVDGAGALGSAALSRVPQAQPRRVSLGRPLTRRLQGSPGYAVRLRGRLSW